uniref:D-alanine--D-alanine ligase n=1 Tax=Candidatus Aschnera chinzeii TaxID=1485666 RepID=A0AAT9G4M8_9ENTR|nr:MAG: D-alanine--D-alanine ligase [Candidatus Aschnera chinzeii]
MNKIAVFLGGNSTERKISLESGKAIVNGLIRASINAYPIDTKNLDINILKKYNFKKIFIALHGRGGEDGIIQGILEYLQLPYTGSGILASALSFDKIRSKQLWIANKLPTPKYLHFNINEMKIISEELLFDKISYLGLPLMVKPNYEGSSFGISKVTKLIELKKAFKKAFLYSNEILIEKYLSGSEYSVAIIGDQVLPSIRIKPTRSFYDYNAKYITNDTKYFCPSGLSYKKEQKIRYLGLMAYKVLGCKGWGRIDIIEDKNENFYILEVNTSPGMTQHSLVPLAAKHAGISFPELVKKILSLNN